MKLWIPSIGDELRLTADWTFPCFTPHGNHKFIAKMRPDTEGRSCYSVAITLPEGTVLSVQRIYIRSGKKEWDSITFSIKELPTSDNGRKSATMKKTSKKAIGRFWAKLRDVNEIEYEPVEH